MGESRRDSPGRIRRGSARGPAALLVFKTSVPAPKGAAGGFDSHTLPPLKDSASEKTPAKRGFCRGRLSPDRLKSHGKSGRESGRGAPSVVFRRARGNIA
jgi:hypothetical protein